MSKIERYERVINLYKEMGNMSEVARKLNLSRQRVHQIVSFMAEENGPLVTNTSNIDWKLLNQLRKEAGVSYKNLGKRAKVSPTTCRQILAGREMYIKNANRSVDHSAVRVAVAIFRLTESHMNKLDKLVEKTCESLHKGTQS